MYSGVKYRLVRLKIMQSSGSAFKFAKAANYHNL